MRTPRPGSGGRRRSRRGRGCGARGWLCPYTRRAVAGTCCGHGSAPRHGWCAMPGCCLSPTFGSYRVVHRRVAYLVDVVRGPCMVTGFLGEPGQGARFLALDCFRRRILPVAPGALEYYPAHPAPHPEHRYLLASVCAGVDGGQMVLVDGRIYVVPASWAVRAGRVAHIAFRPVDRALAWLEVGAVSDFGGASGASGYGLARYGVLGPLDAIRVDVG